jgi:signal peptidase I
MFPLLRPSISQAEAFMLTDELSSRDGKTISKERDAMFAQDRDRIVIVPPVERQWLLISTPFLRIRSALCWMLGATEEHNFRLGDSPLEEGGDGRRSNLERGMVVVFYTPYERERQAVKRIVALEGDIVVPADSSVRASNARGHGRRRIRWEEQRDMDDLCSGRWVRFTIDEDGTQKQMAGMQVPYGHVWLEGVNQAASIDSNELGPISKSLIIGVATGVVYPFSRAMPWKESWQDDCAGRVFRRNGIGRYRAVDRTDEPENRSGDSNGPDNSMAGDNSLIRVPEKWAM